MMWVMLMATDQDSNSKILRKEIEREILSARIAKSEFEKALVRGEIDPEIEAQLRDCLIDLFNVLKRWKDHPDVNESWEEHNLQNIKAWIYETETVEQDAPGKGIATEEKEVALLNRIHPKDVAYLIDVLLDIAIDLNLGPNVGEPTADPKDNLVDPGGEFDE